ncbi:hypothetical protein KM1_258920 [Entamoeba histolytica HM-3:IMSS]|uniref:Uncharacterized protein n=2 Tax=Entamoeba histolytica TaxID=5759 RepID=M7WI36_ENTHI|nr:hypothetical protein KM1_258920 [Entamoeba histolytica HM-3:IMSS]
MILILFLILGFVRSKCPTTNFIINSPTFQKTVESQYSPITKNIGCGDEGRTRATWFSVENKSPSNIAVSLQFYNEQRVLSKGHLTVTVLSSCIGKNSKCISKYSGSEKLNVVTFTLSPNEKVFISHHSEIKGKENKKGEWVRIRAIPFKPTTNLKNNERNVNKQEIKHLVHKTDNVLHEAKNVMKKIQHDVRHQRAKVAAEKIAEKMIQRKMKTGTFVKKEESLMKEKSFPKTIIPKKVELITKTSSVKIGRMKFRPSRPHFVELISFEDQNISADICNKKNGRSRAKYYRVEIPKGKKIRVNTCNKHTDSDVSIGIMVGNTCKQIKKYKCRRMNGEVVEYTPENRQAESVVVRVGSKNIKGYAVVKIDALDIVRNLSRNKKDQLSREGRFRFGGFWGKKWAKLTINKNESSCLNKCKSKTFNQQNKSFCNKCHLEESCKKCNGKKDGECSKCPVLVNNSVIKSNKLKPSHVQLKLNPKTIHINRNVNGKSNVHLLPTVNSTITQTTVGNTTIKAATVDNGTTPKKTVLERFGAKGIMISLLVVAVCGLLLIFGMIIVKFAKRNNNEYNPI